MSSIQSHKLFFIIILCLSHFLYAQTEIKNSTDAGNTAELTNSSPNSLEQNQSPQSTEKEQTNQEDLKYTKFGNKNLVWFNYGLGSPGNGLDTPNQHYELGLDLALNDRMKWGPYLLGVSATKKEYFTFPATGYSEKRIYSVAANCVGVQTRFLVYDVWHGRLGIGLSQTSFSVKEVQTDSPLSSTAVGYKKTIPLGYSAQAALQRVWALEKVNLALELGYNITSVNSNESFTEFYLAGVFRFSVGSDSPTNPYFLKRETPPQPLKDSENVPFDPNTVPRGDEALPK